MTFITAARYSKKRFDGDETIRAQADTVQRHLEGLALDVGLDPELNVRRTEVDGEVRIGLSEEMDIYLREEPGGWRQ